MYSTEGFTDHTPVTMSSGISSGLPQANETTDTLQSDVTCDIEFVKDITGSQCSGTVVSSHLESLPLSTSPVYIPSNYYFYHLPSPLPDDLSEVYPMNKWRRTTGTGFETCIEKLFIHKGCPTERLPYGNYAGDLIVTLNGVPTLIECKQKPTVGVETIQRTRGAMEHYRDRGVTHCMVITTGEFTKDATEEAQKIGVELWDGKRLLEEIYKAQFFYVPEDASEYDPNK